LAVSGIEIQQGDKNLKRRKKGQIAMDCSSNGVDDQKQRATALSAQEQREPRRLEQLNERNKNTQNYPKPI